MTSPPRMSWEDSVLWLRSQPQFAELVSACFYDDPLADAAIRYWQSSEWKAVSTFFPATRGRALDIGAGRGIAAYALAKDGYLVTALEPDASSIVGAGAIRHLASTTSLAIDVVETWGEQLPFEAARFDLVHCRQVLHHARDLAELCRQIGRVLKPGGLFIATREHVLTRREDLADFLKAHPLHHLYGGENAYLLKEYTDAIEAGGVRLERILNPMQSDINLFPETKATTKRRIVRRLHLPGATPVPDFVLSMIGDLSDTPGRLYSFVGRRRQNGNV